MSCRWESPLGSRVGVLLLVLFLALLSAGEAEAQSENVDTELLVLVDTSRVVNPAQFRFSLEGVAGAFESTDVIDAIQAGEMGRIAASLVFFAGPGSQAVAVNWTTISDAASAQAFASAVRASTRPFTTPTTSLAGALGFATAQFGTETGGLDNGFSSDAQAISLMTESFVFPAEDEATVQAARDSALASGVDVINGITVGNRNASAATAYYEANIVGGIAGTVDNARNYNTLPTTAGPALGNQIRAVALVPEPLFGVTLPFALSLCLLRRRRT